MSKQYIEKRDEGYWIKGKRISLDSVVYAFQTGRSPESIQRSFPLLILEEVYGAVTFYLANQSEVDSYLEKEEIEFEKMRVDTYQKDSDWRKKMEKARKELLTPQV